MKNQEIILKSNRSGILTDVAVFSLLILLALVVAFHFHLLPLDEIFTHNADSMYSQEVARDLNSGGSVFDWHMPQAPYFFPDLFLARLFEPISQEVGDVARYYHAVLGLLLLFLAAWLCKILEISVAPVVFSAATVYSTTYFGELSGDRISIYFGLINHHSGCSLIVLLVFVLSFLYIKSHGGQKYHLLFIFVVMVLGVISDSLVSLALLPPVFLYCAIVFLKSSSRFASVLQVLAVMFLATVFAKILGLAIPFPQDRAYFGFLLGHFPQGLLRSTSLFAQDFLQFFTKSALSAFLFICYLASYVVSAKQISMMFQDRCSSDSPLVLLSFFVLLSPVLVIVFQVSLGIYLGVQFSRQWAPLVYLSIVFGVVIYCSWSKRSERLIRYIIAVVLLVFLYHLFSATKQSNEFEKPRNTIFNLIECMRENHLPTGSLYIADYWLSRPIRLLSDGEYEVSSYSLFIGGPMTRSENVVKMRKATPHFVITGGGVPYKPIRKRFGLPGAEICEMRLVAPRLPGRGLEDQINVKILDYRENAEVREQLRAEMAGSGLMMELKYR